MSKEFIESNNEHWYASKKKKDTYYPSVTTVLSAFPKGYGFEKYLANQESYEKSQDIMKAAGRRGTSVHNATQLLETGVTLSREMFSLDEWRLLEGFVLWYKEYQPNAIAIEESFVSDKLKIGGTVDRVYLIGDELVLLDIKTSNAIHANYWAQTAAYVALWEERHPAQKIAKTAILRLAPRRKSGYEFVTHHDGGQMQADLRAFKASHETWKYINPNAKPTILEVPDTLSLKE